jgi:predicted dehydrogenase
LAAFTIVPAYVLGGKKYVAPSDKINLGLIGCGKQSHWLAEVFMKNDNCRLIAFSDVDSQKLDALKKYADKFYGAKGNNKKSGASTYPVYNEMLERKDVDAVIVATPDHWHALASIDAMKAGKDVYCEKPLAHTVYEGRKMVEVARSEKRVVQTGSMQRSWKDFRKACELVRNGFIGQVQTVKVSVGDPAVMCDLPAETTPDYLDWKRWLGPGKKRPFSSILSPPISFDGWPMWRKYWEYGGGIIADWGAHMFDIAQWALDKDESGPTRLIPPVEEGATRGLQLIYSNGIVMTHEDFGRGYAVEFNGSRGTLRVSREFLESDPPGLEKIAIPESGIHLYKSDDHYQDWVDCIRSRKKPICDVEIGHRTSTICNISNIAYKLRRELNWDPVSEKFNDKEADQWLTKKYPSKYKV